MNDPQPAALMLPGDGEHASVSDTDDDLEALYAEADRSGRIPRLTALLVVGVLLAGAFLGGVLVQKNSVSDTSSALPAGFPSGFPAGLGGGGAGGAGAGGGSGTQAASGPAVIGTVVSVTGTEIVVRDLGGTEHIVSTAEDTTVTRSVASKVADLAAGETVSVTGAEDADGNVTAESLTVR